MSNRLLLVEPSRTQATIAEVVLTSAGFSVDMATSVAEAADYLLDNDVNGVIVNYTLSDGTGRDVCTLAKSRSDRTCVIVMADSGGAEQILDSLVAGADGFCIKSADFARLPEQLTRVLARADVDRPRIEETVELAGRKYQLSLTATQWMDVLATALTDLADLRDRCRELTRHSSADDSSEIIVTEPDIAGDLRRDQEAPPSVDVVRKCNDARKERPTVLLAEDSATNQILGTSLLETAGYNVLLATDGHEVLEALDDPATAEIAFILMDLEMPNMDGLEATRIIRSRTCDRHIPILAMTAHTDDHCHTDCLNAGMNACLVKPLRIEDVIQAISQLPHDESPSGLAVTSDGEAGRLSRSGDPDSRSVDWEVALVAVGGDRELLDSIVAATLEEWPMRQSDLKHAIATGDIKTLKRSAHSVGGLLRTFQPNSEPGSAMDIAHQLEHVADGSDTAIMEKLYSQLCESLESVVAELKASQSR